MGGNGKIDFERLARELLSRGLELCREWSPGGKVVGKEYCASDITGGTGSSFKVNLETGEFCDFGRTDIKGRDFTSYYAQRQGVTNIEAGKALAARFGMSGEHAVLLPKKDRGEVCMPPLENCPPDMEHYKYGAPSSSWCYETGKREPMFWIARYEVEGGKQIIPWTWNPTRGEWVMKAWPEPRPLYGLASLVEHPETVVLVVEGEKACEAARQIAGKFHVCVTWPGGANATAKVDWDVLKGRRVILWPDDDKAGTSCMEDIAERLKEIAKDIRVIKVEGKGEGWDAADALQEGWDWGKFRSWAAQRLLAFTVSNDQPGKVAAPPGAGIEPVVEVMPQAHHEVQMNIQVNQAADQTQVVIEPGTSVSQFYAKAGIEIGRGGKVPVNMEIASRLLALRELANSTFWHDEFHKKIFTTNGNCLASEWDDENDLDLLVWFQREMRLATLSLESSRQALCYVASKVKRNEVQDWLNSLVWDGVPRIETFLHDICGVEFCEYTLSVSRCFWISLAARVYEPGCKVDTMLVLHGPQGHFKSTLLQVLGGPWYVDCTEPLNTKDFYLQLQGRLIVELSEMDSLNKSEVTAIKAMLSKAIDPMRVPYGRNTEMFPRQCVFVGTTNQDAILKDPTGHRRFWPVSVGKIDLEAARRDRDQFFAEAVVKYWDGVRWWDVDENIRRAAVARFEEIDTWQEVVEDWMATNTIRETTARHALKEAIKMEDAKMTKRESNRMGDVLRKLGGQRAKVYVGGTRTTGFIFGPEKEAQETVPF